MPEYLVVPVAELLVSNMLVLPLAMSSTVLLMQRGSPVKQALGAVAMSFLLGYIALVIAVLLAVRARHQMNWLQYTSHRQKQNGSNSDGSAAKPGDDAADSKAADLPQLKCEDSRMVLHAAAAAGPAGAVSDTNADKQGGSSRHDHQAGPEARLTPSGRLLMRFAPPHAHGCWERPELAVLRQLRQEYQSGWRAVSAFAEHAQARLYSYIARARHAWLALRSAHTICGVRFCRAGRPGAPGVEPVDC